MTQRIVIIGGGPAGYEAALVAGELGAEVTIVVSKGSQEPSPTPSPSDSDPIFPPPGGTDDPGDQPSDEPSPDPSPSPTDGGG